MKEFDKAVAVVTGASRGLGYQVARLLAKKKYSYHWVGPNYWRVRGTI